MVINGTLAFNCREEVGRAAQRSRGQDGWAGRALTAITES